MIYQLCITYQLLVLLTSVNGIPIEDFFPFNGDKVCLIDATTGLVHTTNTLDGSGRPVNELNSGDCDEYRLSPNDDASSHNISITVTFPFFAKRFMNVFINTNGVISFTAAVPTFTPEPFPISGRFIIAPFWADVDTRGVGQVYFRETTDNQLMKVAKRVLDRATHQVIGLSRFIPRWLLIATWHQVGYFSSHTDLTNTFQAVLITDGRHSFAIFNYLDDGINWNKGDASTVPAQVGFNFGGSMPQTFTLPGSRTENITEIDTDSNLNIGGQFVFRIDDTVPPNVCNNSTERLRPDPDTPSIIGGGVMFLTGPCFSDEIENITCLFTDKNGDVTHFELPDGREINIIINGITVQQKAVCPLPLFRTLGNHTVIITLNDNTTYSAFFEVVPALYRNPDIKVLDNDGEREFFLIEFMKDYNGKWDTDQLNQDDYNETTDINFIIENWVFNIHPVTEVGRWINRKNLQRRQSELFIVKQQNNSNGSFSFTQLTNAPAKVRFDNSIIVIRKRTKHLEILYTTTFLSFVPKVQGFKDREAIVEYCRQWHSNTEDIIKPDDLNSCPCSLDSARIHPDLVDDFTCSPTETNCHENINARRCFLRKLNNSNFGQQCCYDHNGAYTTQEIPAGSADFEYPMDSYLLHQSSDYFPYRACCIDSKDDDFCKMYYEKRPKDSGNPNVSCQDVVPRTGNAGGSGDPHFITLDGKQYTFNGLGEYTLLDALDGEFVIQIQTKQAVDQDGQDIKASTISVIAMKQKDKPTIQAHLHGLDGIQVVVESDSGFTELDFEFAPNRLFDGGHVSVEAEFTRSFSFENSVVVTIKAANDILSFQLFIPESFFNNTKGLLGVWNNNQEDDFLRPDGTILAINSTEDVVFHQFGEQWSVDESDSILIIIRDAPRTTRNSAYVPVFVTPIVDTELEAVIEETCGDNSECAYDIAVTGNVDVGRETLDDIEEHMAIINLSLPIICNPPCENGAPCVANDTCNCNTGFTGSTCEVKIIRCDTPCKNGGNCTGLEQCSCPKDFYGQHCDIYNPCIMSPCKQGCLVTDSGYICQCNSKHVLAADGITCIKCAQSNNPTWHVALCNASSDDTICSGTAISDQWVLTSARCACNNGVGINKQSLSIRFGKIRTCSYRDTNELQLTASEIHCYPNYTSDALTVDIAAIKLESPIPVNVMKQSPPLCTANARKGKELFFSKGNVEIFGWGKVGEVVDKESTLQSSGNIVVDVVMDCRNVFKKERVKDRSSRGIMCTVANTTSACTGNYGSAVVAREKNTMYFGAIVSKMTSVCGATNSYLAHSKLFTKTAFEWVVSTTQS